MENINDFKKNSELDFWKGVLEKEKIFNNLFYKEYYTKHFIFDEKDFKDKNILDIGCGPRGSLEWANMANLRIGLDPLVNDYYKLNGGTLTHDMKYVCAGSENMPFPDEFFDFIFTINSLDHIDNLDLTINEIKRVLKVGGYFCCLVETNHDPTPCEPITIDFDLKNRFLDEFKLIEQREYENNHEGMCLILNEELFYDWNNEEKRPGLLYLKMKKLKEHNVDEVEEKNNFEEIKNKYISKTYENLINENLTLEKENQEFKELIKKYKARKVVRFADFFKK